eukprot:6229101-Amphidinium_carterae.1
MGVSKSKGGLELMWQFYKDEFHRIHDMAAINASCSGFSTLDKAKDIEEFFAKNPLPLSTRTIAQVLEATRNRAKTLTVAMTTDISKPAFWRSLLALHLGTVSRRDEKRLARELEAARWFTGSSLTTYANDRFESAFASSSSAPKLSWRPPLGCNYSRYVSVYSHSHEIHASFDVAL